MSTRAAHEMSACEFAKTVSVVPVVVGRGKTGAAKNGEPRLLVDDRDGLETVRRELGRAYDGAADDTWPARWDWIVMATSQLLKSCVFDDSGVYDARFPGGRGILFVKLPVPYPRETYVRLAHRLRIEEAAAAGLTIDWPRVFAEHPILAEKYDASGA